MKASFKVTPCRCFYAVVVLPLIQFLKRPDRWTQTWYADRLACVVKLVGLKEGFQRLRDLGLDYGYHPELTKSVLVVEPSGMVEAQELPGDLELKIIPDHRCLGEFVGNHGSMVDYVRSVINTWVHYIPQLAKEAEFQPQAVYAALSHSVQFEQTLFSWVVLDHLSLSGHIIHVDAIIEKFWHTLFSERMSDRAIYFLPSS